MSYFNVWGTRLECEARRKSVPQTLDPTPFGERFRRRGWRCSYGSYLGFFFLQFSFDFLWDACTMSNPGVCFSFVMRMDGSMVQIDIKTASYSWRLSSSKTIIFCYWWLQMMNTNKPHFKIKGCLVPGRESALSSDVWFS
jgi:hypothetical protein